MPTGGLDIGALFSTIFATDAAAAGATAAGVGAADAGLGAAGAGLLTGAGTLDAGLAAGAGATAGLGATGAGLLTGAGTLDAGLAGGAAAGLSGAGAALDTAAGAGGVAAPATGISGPTSGATLASNVASAATPGTGAGAALSPASTLIAPGGPTGSGLMTGAGTLDATAGTGVGAGVTPAASAAAPTTDSGLSGLLGKAGTFVEKNPFQVAGLGILGTEMLMGNKPLPGQAQLQEQANEAATLGRTLTGYSLTGTLPPGMKSIVDQNTNAAKAAIRSQYAQLGYAGSTAEVQALHQVDEAATAQIAQIANELMQQGRSFSSLSDQELSQLLNVQLSQEKGLQDSLAKFAAGLAGAKLS